MNTSTAIPKTLRAWHIALLGPLCLVAAGCGSLPDKLASDEKTLTVRAQRNGYMLVAVAQRDAEDWPALGTCKAMPHAAVSEADDHRRPARRLEDLSWKTLDRAHGVNSGTVRIVGGKRELSLAPSMEGHYHMRENEGELWVGGETLTVSSDGDAVPRFSVEVPAPSPVVLLAPTAPVQEISLLNDLELRWSEGAGEVRVELESYLTRQVVHCRYAADVTSATVPKVVFRNFAEGWGHLWVHRISEVRTTVDGWQITAEARSFANTGKIKLLLR